MMWDQVLIRLADVLGVDAVLSAMFPQRMGPTSGEFRIPSLEWTLITDTENELWAPCIIQFDIWHPEMAQIVIAERRLRTLFHTAPLPFRVDDLDIYGEYIDGSVLAVPDRSSHNGRALRFRFTSLRSKYALETPITLTP